ncbi:MAG: hypothetical protein RR559_07550, partial [Bacteroides sp.]
MKAQLGGICRGDGKIYVRLLVSNLVEGSSLKAGAVSSNNVFIPCGIYEVLSNAYGNERTFVFVLPILRVRSALCSIVEIDEKG